ncbi:hypothetical protein [Fodinibius sp.]|uniref:hypothetical protein n=1 Tax=Fodinibius sp. TaxID=1872440 RepID=UPI002ACD75B7|nr:hypothetical protein [Fodinibius sp.]MDZ7660548.1 hypothetical protein [Fodinibius sp.]
MVLRSQGATDLRLCDFARQNYADGKRWPDGTFDDIIERISDLFSSKAVMLVLREGMAGLQEHHG